jgi:hypothetical protein
MVKVRKLLTEKHHHIQKVRCVLHDFNQIVKHSLEHPSVADTIKKDKSLVNYFTMSIYYSEVLDKWRATLEIKRQLETFCETRWYLYPEK